MREELLQMASCPNCGRQTLRTKDWACQWCGYPLISRAFKVIDKTFKELQAERGMAGKAAGAESELEPGIDIEPLPELPRPVYKPVSRPAPPLEPPLPPPSLRPEPKVEPRPVSQPPPLRPVVPPVTRPEPVTRALPEPVNNPELKPVVIPPAPPIILPPATAAQPVPEVKREIPPVVIPPPPVPEVKLEAPPLIKPQITPLPVPEVKIAAPPPPPVPAARIEPEPPRPKPEIIIEPAPPVVPTIKLEAIRDGMEITADQIDELYRADKSGAHSKFAGKTITIRGKVEKIFIKEHLDVRYIVLTGNQKLASSIRCTFNQEESSKASRLNEGDDVAVRGKYDGYSKNIMFKDCAII
jgi:ribosomal protein L37E